MIAVRNRENVDDNLVLVVPEVDIKKVKTDNAYVCQNRRSFKGGPFKKDASYIAFYYKGAIQAIAKIESIEDDVDMKDPGVKIKNPNNYLKLSDDDKLRTVIRFCNGSFKEVNIPIEGKFVQGQWYTSYKKLQF